MSERLSLRPLSYRDACAYVQEHHRHHRPPQGWKFGIAAHAAEQLVGVVMVGRPVARALDDGLTLEVIRCCTDGARNACSMLYGAAWRAARAMGYRRLVTYTLAEESGASLKAAGWRATQETKGGSWDCPSRRRTDKAPTTPKTRWEIAT